MTLKNVHLPAGTLTRQADHPAGLSPTGVAPAVYAAALSLVAALVHLWVALGHFEVW